jgi:hypothetical protein
VTIDQAISAIGARITIAESGEPDAEVEITSGGVRAERDVEPALLASSAMAIKSWQRAVIDYAEDEGASAIVLRDGPHLDKWQITVTDRNGTHRVAESRWSVTAKIGVLRSPA